MILNVEERPLKWVKDNASRSNIAEDFDQNVLDRIGGDVVAMYHADCASREEWKETVERGLKTAKQTLEKKTTPWQDAANTKDPLIAVAAMQFAARAGAEVVRGEDVVKTKVTGEDPNSLKEQRGKRLSTFLSYQCLEQMTEWMPDTDQLLTSESIIGMYYKKTYYDPILKRITSVAVSPMKYVINEAARDLETAERGTHELEFYRNEVIERIRSGLWLDIEEHLEKDDDGKYEQFLEQSCRYDLDGDGYKEPYVIVVHRDNGKVARIAPNYLESDIEANKKGEIIRIAAQQHFTLFPFLPSVDGKFHKTGWAHLLGPITEEINTVTNQLLDAGTLANCPPGFIGRGAKLPAGPVRTAPGKLIPVESTGQALRDNVFFPPFPGPSQVLFNLLARLDEKGNKLSTVSDVMTGDTPGANVPATTTLALLDQGLKVFTNILKRQYRGFQQEFAKIYRLNAIYLTDAEYIRVIDITAEEMQALGIPYGPTNIPEGANELVKIDFNASDCDITPVMDPTAASEALRLARLNAMVQAGNLPPAIGRIYLKGIGVPQSDIDAIFPQVDPANQPPDPKVVELQAKITDMQRKGDIAEKTLLLKHMEMEQKEAIAVREIAKLDAEIVEIKSRSILNLANAEKAEIGTQVDIYRAEMDQLNTDTDRQIQTIAQSEEGKKDGQDTDNGSTGNSRAANGAGGAGAVEERQANEEGTPVYQPEGRGIQGGMGNGAVPGPNGGANGAGELSLLGADTGTNFRAQPGGLSSAAESGELR